MQDHLIVYVDDEKPNRIVFERSFGGRLRIKSFESPTEALEFLRRESASVLVTDQRMPEMSGNELLARVKAERPDIVRIIITAYSDLDQILHAVNEGLVARYIIKPWERAELEQILNWAIEEHAANRRRASHDREILLRERQFTTSSVARLVLAELNGSLATLGPAGAALGALAGRMHRFVDAQKADETSSEPDQVVHQALSVCRAEAGAASVRLLHEAPAGLPHARLGAAELTRVLIELIGNAILAIAERGTGPGQVAVRVTEEPDRLCFAIIDDGPGMTAETQKAAGTPFFSTRPEGAGLGLALCRRVVEGAGGVLELESTPTGTTARFWLPRAPA